MMFEIITAVAVVFFVVMGYVQLQNYLSSNGPELRRLGYAQLQTYLSRNGPELRKVKCLIVNIYSVWLLVGVLILLSSSEPPERLIKAVYNYLIYGSFNWLRDGSFHHHLIDGSVYMTGKLGYDAEGIDNALTAVKTVLMAVMALFLPALFALYTSLRKDIPALYRDTKSEDTRRIIRGFEERYEVLDRWLKPMSQFLFYLLIGVLICSFCIDFIENVNVKGDVTNILQSLSYAVFVGYTLLLTFYYRIVVPFYKDATKLRS